MQYILVFHTYNIITDVIVVIVVVVIIIIITVIVLLLSARSQHTNVVIDFSSS